MTFVVFYNCCLDVYLIILSKTRQLQGSLQRVSLYCTSCLTVYSWINLNGTELRYFTFNSTGVLLLSVLSIMTIPTIYHGFIYSSGDETRKFNIYHAALIALMTFMTGAYLANGMTVLWIFVEATTLAVGLLIYHDRTEIALEATWKYVFICSAGIALAYLGILFLGFIYGREDAASLSFSSLANINKPGQSDVSENSICVCCHWIQHQRWDSFRCTLLQLMRIQLPLLR